MTNFIPIFPLGLVVYPREPLHLHIFEPRYRQLINECLQSGKPFGIPVVIDKKISDTKIETTINKTKLICQKNIINDFSVNFYMICMHLQDSYWCSYLVLPPNKPLWCVVLF